MRAAASRVSVPLPLLSASVCYPDTLNLVLSFRRITKERGTDSGSGRGRMDGDSCLICGSRGCLSLFVDVPRSPCTILSDAQLVIGDF